MPMMRGRKREKLRTAAPLPARRLSVFSWILYDFANTIYSMNVVTMYFSLWVTVNLAREDLWVSFGNSTSMLLVALSMPVLGVISDRRGRRMPFLRGLTLLSVSATAFIGLTGYTVTNVSLKIILAVAFFILANYAYQGALVFYNALLPVVSDTRRMGRISGYGVSFGYIGAVVGLLMVMPFMEGRIPFLRLEFKRLQGKYQNLVQAKLNQHSFVDTTASEDANYVYRVIVMTPTGKALNLPIRVTSKDSVITLPDGSRQRAVALTWKLAGEEKLPDEGYYDILRRQSGWGRVGTFIPTALLFLFFSLPTLVFIKEFPSQKIDFCEKWGVGIKRSFRKVWNDLCYTRKYPGVLRFLVAKFFYEEGIQTAIIFMAVYAVKVMGFPNTVLIPYFMVTTTAAAFGSLGFGFITDRFGPKKTLAFVIAGWIVCLLALILATNQWTFWLLGCLIGIFLGSTWTSARPLLVSLVPKETLGEFFGLYSLSGKAAAIIGPYVWGVVVYMLAAYGDSVKYRAAVGALALMMSIGLAILVRVPAKRLAGAVNSPNFQKIV